MGQHLKYYYYAAAAAAAIMAIIMNQASHSYLLPYGCARLNTERSLFSEIDYGIKNLATGTSSVIDILVYTGALVH
jgi:hypothetical protein